MKFCFYNKKFFLRFLARESRALGVSFILSPFLQAFSQSCRLFSNVGIFLYFWYQKLSSFSMTILYVILPQSFMYCPIIYNKKYPFLQAFSQSCCLFSNIGIFLYLLIPEILKLLHATFELHLNVFYGSFFKSIISFHSKSIFMGANSF